MKKILLSMMLGFAASAACAGSFRLRNVFSDGMVLQRDAPIVFAGRAEPLQTVEVSFAGMTVRVKADQDGCWRSQLKPLAAGGPHEATFRAGDETLRLKDVLIGELWLTSGQSNMEMPVWSKDAVWYRMTNGQEIAAAAKDGELRFFGVPLEADCLRRHDDVPIPEKPHVWQRGDDPEAVKWFSGTAYLFGCELRRRLKVPVGIVNASWGGSRIEPWIAPRALVASKLQPEIDRMVRSWSIPGNRDVCAPGSMYNAMIAPLDVFRFRGAAWYQGCSNAGANDWPRYDALQRALVDGFRTTFARPDMAFVCVQLAGYVTNRPDKRFSDAEVAARAPDETGFVAIRDEQVRIRDVRGCDCATAFDIGDHSDIHPKNKEEVARRLAGLAAGLCYGGTEKARGPEAVKIDRNGAAFEITFDEPLVLKGGKIGEHEFTFVDAAGKVAWAKAERVAPTVVRVTCDAIKEPAHVDYCRVPFVFASSLFNRDGYPALPFKLSPPARGNQ